MTVVIDSRSDLNLDSLGRVALNREPVSISDRVLAHMRETNQAFQDYVSQHSDSFIYGVTAGGGPDARRHYTLEEARQRHRLEWPWLTLSFGGELLPEYVSRAAIFARLALFITGNTATHPDRALALAATLQETVRRLPSHGLVAAGELMPNFVLRGERPSVDDEGFPAGTGNGAPVSAGLAGLTAIFARRRLQFAQRVFALSVDAFGARLDSFDPAVKGLTGDPFEDAVVDAIAALLTGSDASCRLGHVPASYQVLRGVLGQTHRAVSQLVDVAETSLREAASNPTFLFEDARHQSAVVSTGAFHNAAYAPAADGVSGSWLDLALVAHRHAVKLHRGPVSGLPDRLLPVGTDYTRGFSTTYLEYVPVQNIEEMRRLAQPTLLTPAEIAASDQDDLAITAPLAFLTERAVAHRLDEVLTVLAVTSSQALHVVDRSCATPLSPLLEFVRAHVPPVESRRELGVECGALAHAITRAIERDEPPDQ